MFHNLNNTPMSDSDLARTYLTATKLLKVTGPPNTQQHKSQFQSPRPERRQGVSLAAINPSPKWLP